MHIMPYCCGLGIAACLESRRGCVLITFNSKRIMLITVELGYNGYCDAQWERIKKMREDGKESWITGLQNGMLMAY